MAGLGVILLVVGLVWFGIVYFTWRAQEYIITNRRVLKVEGLLDKKSGDSSLDKINDAVLKQGLLARMLHYGDLDILTANEEAIDRYQMLAHVVDFKKAMLNAKNNLEDGYRGRPARWPAGSPRAAASSSRRRDRHPGQAGRSARQGRDHARPSTRPRRPSCSAACSPAATCEATPRRAARYDTAARPASLRLSLAVVRHRPRRSSGSALFFLIAGPVHECAHAFTAWKLGDGTAKLFGRVSLDPVVHFDPIGGGC